MATEEFKPETAYVISGQENWNPELERWTWMNDGSHMALPYWYSMSGDGQIIVGRQTRLWLNLPDSVKARAVPWIPDPTLAEAPIKPLPRELGDDNYSTLHLGGDSGPEIYVLIYKSHAEGIPDDYSVTVPTRIQTAQQFTRLVRAQYRLDSAEFSGLGRPRNDDERSLYDIKENWYLNYSAAKSRLRFQKPDSISIGLYDGSNIAWGGRDKFEKYDPGVARVLEDLEGAPMASFHPAGHDRSQLAQFFSTFGTRTAQRDLGTVVNFIESHGTYVAMEPALVAGPSLVG